MRLTSLLQSIAMKYPQNLVAAQLRDVDRIAFHIQLVRDRKGKAITICDIGGGVGLFSVGCAALGMRSILIDDFQDEVNLRLGESALEVHKAYGVEVISRDVISHRVDLEPGSLDAITCFESMEHWHHSPRRLFNALKIALKQQGLFVLSTPNCVDLARRLAVPFGRGQWSSIESWYDSETFRGHVREPDVHDLLHIARDMGLTKVETLGRNWWAYTRFDNSPLKPVAIIIGQMLRLRPSLCSTIYLAGYA
jgi:SAM-dependent methyltransferase